MLETLQGHPVKIKSSILTNHMLHSSKIKVCLNKEKHLFALFLIKGFR